MHQPTPQSDLGRNISTSRNQTLAHIRNARYCDAAAKEAISFAPLVKNRNGKLARMTGFQQQRKAKSHWLATLTI